MDCLRSVTSVLPWICIQCGPGYTQGFTLKKYMKTHSRGNLFNCKKCGLGLSQCCNFKKHMETHAGVFCTERSVVQGFHNVDLEGTYGNTYQKNLLNCKECGSGFLSVLKLAGIHGNTFMLKCIKCNAGFSRGLQVDAHIQTQTGENPFYCQEC